jgi:hypothetical protein
MKRAWNVLAGLGLMATLVSGVLHAPGPVLASDEDEEERQEQVVEEKNPDLSDGDVAGLIYHIDGNDQERVVTILDQDIGVAVKAYVRAPGLLSMIKSSQICIGRYVTAHGVRTNEQLLEAQGFDVDQTTQCHTLPSK